MSKSICEICLRHVYVQWLWRLVSTNTGEERLMLLRQFIIVLFTIIIIYYYWHIYPPITRKRRSAVRARLGVAGHLSTTLRWGNPVKCLSQRHNK